MENLNAFAPKGLQAVRWLTLLLLLTLGVPPFAAARSGASSLSFAASISTVAAATAGTAEAAATTTAKPIQATDCTECHGSNVVAAHHETDYFTSGQCTYCHIGVTTSGDCATCHTFVPQQNVHHDTPAATSGDYADCSQCHTEVGPLSDCAFCHQGEIQDRHHTAASQQTIDCVSCHTSIQSGEGCQSCHRADTRAAHHAAAEAKSIACSSCHTGIAPRVDCMDCHTADSWGQGQTAGAVHHPLSAAGNLDCNTCHSGITPIGGCGDCHSFAVRNRHHSTEVGSLYGVDCFDCHTLNIVGSGYRVLQPTPEQCEACHTGVTQGLTGPFFPMATISAVHHTASSNCAACHEGIDTVSGALDCATCHATQTKNGSPAMHHATETATRPMPDGSIGDCGVCHIGVSTAGLDCSSCHNGSIASPGTAASHHATDSYALGLCTFCHQSTEISAIVCADCHAPDTSNPRNHHGQPAYAAGNCTVCHSTIVLNGSGCQDCHAGDIPALHHGEPLVNVGGDCSVCHQSASDPGICANCHESSPHHTTAWSLDGDCAHCHYIPTTALDRPMQAACRECHGLYQHDKNTQPIQDYGACAACHGTTPYHAAPARAVGYTRTAPGKGIFAIFWAQFTNNGQDQEDTFLEDIEPNGDDMDDEGGRRWRDPTLNFTMKSITHNSRTYSVPAFPNLPGTSRDGSSGGETTPPPAEEINLALNKSASASSYESSSYSASKAVDGNTSTYWWKNSDRSHWLRVDLGQRQAISKVVVKWGQEYARQYNIEISNDGDSWSRVKQEGSGNGGDDIISFNSREARYVQVYCREDNRNGYQITELEIYK